MRISDWSSDVCSSDLQDVRKACQECESKMQALGLVPYFLVSPMMFGKRELALGAKVDPRFGPVVMLSDGGKFIESMPDYHLLVPPFSIDNACKGLKALRIAPLFHGARGEPPLPFRSEERRVREEGVRQCRHRGC